MENLPEKMSPRGTLEVGSDILPPFAQEIRSRAAQASPKVKDKVMERINYWTSLSRDRSDLTHVIDKETNEIRADLENMSENPDHPYYEEFYKGWTPSDIRELYKVFYGENPSNSKIIEGDPIRKQLGSQ